MFSKKSTLIKKEQKPKKLKLQLIQAKEVLNDLRIYIRKNKFRDGNEEIHFFKNIKPNIYDDFIFYNNQLKYQVSKHNKFYFKK